MFPKAPLKKYGQAVEKFTVRKLLNNYIVLSLKNRRDRMIGQRLSGRLEMER